MALLPMYVQGATPTLAQRHGLVKAPPAVLSEQEWLSMHARSQERQDSQHECCICREHFGLQEQVLLSCSHVFHKQCILSFERYASLLQALVAWQPALHPMILATLSQQHT